LSFFSNLESVVSELVRYDGEIAPNLAWSGAIPEDAIIAAPLEKPIIAFVGGAHKAEAVLGALLGQWINGLVIDETCVRTILATE
jgi:hypothetical protein